MTELPKTLTFRMPAEASPLGYRQRPTTPLLEVERLRKTFAHADAPAVHRVSLALGDGELLALLGPSGCGKTTTLRMIGGFEQPDEGRITFQGHDITHLPPESRGIGFVFQDYALFPHLSVLDNVKFGLRALPRAQAQDRADEMLRLVGLSDLGKRRPHQLSGGQQQRVALARALAVAPKLILLDEPFSNLDAKMRVETRQEVRRLLKKTGATGILVTHDQEEALALADRIAVMDGGRVVQVGTPDEIYRREFHRSVELSVRHGDRHDRADRLWQPADVARGEWRGTPGGASRTDHAHARPRGHRNHRRARIPGT